MPFANSYALESELSVVVEGVFAAALDFKRGIECAHDCMHTQRKVSDWKHERRVAEYRLWEIENWNIVPMDGCLPCT